MKNYIKLLLLLSNVFLFSFSLFAQSPVDEPDEGSGVPGEPVVTNISISGSCPETYRFAASKGTDALGLYWYDDLNGDYVHEGSFYDRFCDANTVVYVRSFNGEGISNAVSITLTLNEPQTPTASNKQTCPGQTVSLTASNGGNNVIYRWYKQSSGGSVWKTGQSVTSEVINTNTNYWVSAYASSGGCESGRKQVSVTLKNTADVPQVTGNSPLCGPGNVTLNASVSELEETPHNIVWYEEDQTTVLHTGKSYTDYISASKKIYVRAENAIYCDSPFEEVDIVVSSRPAAPVTTDGTVCSGGMVTLTASGAPSGGYYRWYDAQRNRITSAGTGSTYTVAISADEIYYVTAVSSDGCESEAFSQVNAIRIDPPQIPSASDVTRCGTGTVTLTASGSGADVTYHWYENLMDITPFDTGVSVSSLEVQAGQYKYFYVAAVNSEGCESTNRKQVKVTAHSLPDVTVENDFSIALNADLYVLYAEPAGGNWTGTGVQGNSFDPAVAGIGTYTLTYSFTNPQGCTLADDLLVTVTKRDLNYVKRVAVRVEGVDEVSDLADSTVYSYTEKKDYFDGLGRPLQTVIKGGSPAAFDQVQAFAYDDFGRQTTSYLPYAASEQSGDYRAHALIKDGISAEGELYKFYQEAEKVAVSDYPYSKVILESSPLARPLEQGAAGEAWQPGGHTVSYEYRFNNNTVHYWEVTGNNLLRSTYNPETLQVKSMTDEQGNLVEEFTDMMGRVVRKVVYRNSIPAITDYAYDTYGNLSYVLPPKLSDSLYSRNPTAVELKSLAFQYRYDERQRMTAKKVPGSGWVYMLYDKWDRLVATQDAVQRDSSEWTFTKYDALNRPVMTGLWNSTITLTGKPDTDKEELDALQTLVASAAGRFETTQGIGIGYTLDQTFPVDAQESRFLTVTYYDNYKYPGRKSFEAADAPGISHAQVFDSRTVTASEDSSYALMHVKAELNIEGSFEWDIATDGAFEAVFVETNRPATYNTRVKGQVTGQKVRMLEPDGTLSDNWLTTSTYYDDRYRVVQTISDHHQTNKGYEIVSNSYDFTGQLTESYREFLASPGFTEYQFFDYDHAGRVLRTWHSLDGGDTVLLAENEYNELGELVTKKLHSENEGASFIEATDYRYNIRGWMTQIGGAGDKFQMSLHYNDPDTTHGVDAQFNGNISEISWTTEGLGEQTFAYSYDGMNRLTDAAYFASGADGAFNVSGINYDLNGNILALNRKKGGNFIDQLDYQYAGNQLLNVEDVSTTAGFENGNVRATLTEEEYEYDANGNMTSDANKGITSIEYNLLNLPRKVTIQNDPDTLSIISYIYDATGRKLYYESELKSFHEEDEKWVSSFIKRDYINGAHFENDKFDFLQTAEGRVINPATVPVYEYNLTDHLGNVRVLLAEDGTVKQSTDYYPFGLTMRQSDVPSPDNRYQYNGKELQEKTQWLDYGARMYDAALGRWHVVDPLADFYFATTPFAYAANTPINAIDPDGQVVIFINGFHTGDGGKPNYWRKYKYRLRENHWAEDRSIKKVEDYIHSFDREVMYHFNDYNAKYYDGSVGGVYSLLSGNLAAGYREALGHGKGQKEAEMIINSLERDKSGNIIESIKMISHSMGGSYAKGFVRALMEYIEKNNIQGVHISEYDFAPFQPEEQKAVGGVPTWQYSHYNDNVAGDDPIEGASQGDTSSDWSQTHSIHSFFNQIANLPVGNYKVVDGVIVKAE